MGEAGICIEQYMQKKKRRRQRCCSRNRRDKISKMFQNVTSVVLHNDVSEAEVRGIDRREREVKFRIIKQLIENASSKCKLN